ncbi:hypothetical protein FACS1894181_10690 [Bacteroidia bacterium]|nr:hypothetical protein FACS1894181_10690 [Bacteroidia bacterium]
MLHSLHIKNYRNLRDFRIETLKRVNLITGKNNTGKSSVLEAAAIYVSEGKFHRLCQILEMRGEFSAYSGISDFEAGVESFSSLFTRGQNPFKLEISIKDTDEVTLKFARFFNDIESDKGPGHIIMREVSMDVVSEAYPSFRLGLKVKKGDEAEYISIDRIYSYKRGYERPQTPNIQYVHTGSFDENTNGKLFDNIALTEKKAFVIEALQLIEPLTEDIHFRGEEKRSAYIKLAGNAEILPVRSMGDGMNRILTIILAIVNASGGYFLIDEFENGLHYKVQEKIWEIIFKLAKQLDVQVFATTHSNDCILGFTQALNSESIEGKLMRLDNKRGEIKEVEFLSEELQIAGNQNIEIR